MLILAWIICCVLFAAALSVLLWTAFATPQFKEGLRTFKNGFSTAIRGWGLSKPRYPVELWKWETMQDEDVCEDCLERSSWAPMDIADWMKEGLPRTPEADTHCGEHCRCQLIRHQPKGLLKRQPKI